MDYKKDWLPRLLALDRKRRFKEEVIGAVVLCVLWYVFIVLIATV